MKKLGKALIIIISLIVLFLGYFTYFYKVDVNEFFVEDLTQVYTNSEISKSKYEEIEKVFIEKGKEEDWKEIENIKKYIKEVNVFSFETLDEQLKDEVLVLDLGIAYLYAKMKLNEYFVEEKKYYVLKEEIMQNDEKVWLIPYKGYFVLSKNKESIKKILSFDSSINNELLAMKEKSNKSDYGNILIDTKSVTFPQEVGIEGIIIDLNTGIENLNTEVRFLGKGELYEALEAQPIERKLTKYIGEDKLYISSEKIGEIAVEIVKMNSKEEIELFNNLLFFVGTNIESILGNIDDEVIVDIETNYFIIPLKEEKSIKKLFKIFSKNDEINLGDISLKLDKNILKNGEIKEIKETIMKENQFLYANLLLKKLNKEYFSDENRVEIKGEVKDGEISLTLNFDKEVTYEVLDKIID